jgi:hypothetical protein
MRKGLVTLGVVALVLAVSPGFAEAPILSCLPDIVISDVEQNSQTADSNLFIFSDAVDLDELVEDADTADDLLRWSGIDPAGDISINGIALNDPGVNTLEPGAQDLRAVNVDGSATFEDDNWNATPPTTDGETKETMITLYVSDGTTVSEGVMKVITVNTVSDTGPGDEVVPVPLATYDFASNEQGWGWFAVAPILQEVAHSYSGGALRMTETASVGALQFGAWESPQDPTVAIEPKLGCIMRARYSISSSGVASPTAAPGLRLRGATVRVTSDGAGGWIPDFLTEDYNSLDQVFVGTTNFFMGSGDFDNRVPGTGNTYTLYVFPRQVAESLQSPDPTNPVVHYFTADMLDTDAEGDGGTYIIDSVQIDGIDRPELGAGTAVPELSFTDFSTGWSAGIQPLPGGTINQAGLVAAVGADLTITVANGNEWFIAFAEHTDGVALDSGRIYRLAYSMTSSELPGGDEGPLIRVNVDSANFVWNAYKELQGGSLLARLTSTPSLMELWLEAPPALVSTPGLTEPMKPKINSYLATNIAAWPFFRVVSGTVQCTELQTEVFDSLP